MNVNVTAAPTARPTQMTMETMARVRPAAYWLLIAAQGLLLLVVNAAVRVRPRVVKRTATL